MSDFVSISKTASAAGITPQAIYLMIKEGRAESLEIADKIVLPRKEAKRIIREQKRRIRHNGNNHHK